MASDIKEAIRRLIYQYTVEGADKVMATQEAVTAATSKTDQASLSLEKSFGNLERRYVSTVRFQEDYQKVQERVNNAVAQNPSLQERANAVLAAASDHFEKLAAKASGSSLAISFIAREFTHLLSPVAVIGAAMTGIGLAFAAIAESAGKSRVTVAQALEELNRLLAENKKLIDERTSAQDRMFAQNKDVTDIQLMQNKVDLQQRLNELQRKAAYEMGQAVGTTALPGAPALPDMSAYEELTAAIQKLQQAINAGKPGIEEYNAALGKIGKAHPELQQLIADYTKAGEQAVQAAQGLTKNQVALEKIKTDADAIAAGFASLAQFKFTQLQAEQTADAMERMANYANQLKVAYPDLSTSAAKQLEIMQAQLAVAQARTKEEELIAQQYLDQLQYQQQGLQYEDQLRLAAAKRALAEAQAKKQADSIDAQRRGEQDHTDQVAEAQRRKQQDDEALNEARQRAAAAAADQQAQMMADSADSSADLANNMKNTVTYTWQFVDALDIALVAFHSQSIAAQVDQRLRLMSTTFDPNKQYTVQTDPMHQVAQKNALEQIYGADMVKATTMFKGTMQEQTFYSLDTEKYNQSLQVDPSLITGAQNISSPAAAAASLSNVLSLGLQSGLGNVTRLIDAVTDKGTQASLIQQAMSYIQSTQPPTLARDEMINELTDKLQQLTSSTDSLNSTMQNALSPFYSQDPRTTHLGFRAGVVGNEDWLAAGAGNQSAALAAILGAGATAPGMADGGSFIVGGGYSANDNKIAAFPVASGEQVIVNRNRAGQSGQVIQIDARTIINGSVDADVFARMKVSKYQQTQRMRAGLAQAS